LSGRQCGSRRQGDGQLAAIGQTQALPTALARFDIQRQGQGVDAFGRCVVQCVQVNQHGGLCAQKRK